jgi:hypothetical protein
VHKFDKKVVLNAKTKFSVESYNSFYDMELNAELIKQYKVEGLEGLLLSPCATRTTNASTGDVHFSTCGNCCLGGIRTLPRTTQREGQTIQAQPQKFTATITFNVVEGLTTKSNFKVGNATVTQIPVNSNIATTGYKLQGMTKDALVVNEWDYRCANWVYVVLSRVRTRKGLFLTKPLDLDREFNVSQSLIDFENRIRTNLEQPTLDKLAQKGHYRTGGTRDAE